MSRGGEKSEKPTEKRLREARRKGQVAKSQDLTSALLLIAASAILTIAGRWSGAQLAANMQSSIKRAAEFKGALDPAAALGYLLGAVSVMALVLAPLFIALIILAALVNYLQVGPIFAFEPVKPSLNKLNPAEGFKQKFLKGRPYIELCKTILKMIVTAIVIMMTLWGNRGNIMELTRQPVPAALSVVSYMIFEIGVKVGIAFLLVAVGDFFLQRFLHLKEMKMTKQEVKDEYKETEGNPLHKIVRRQLHREILTRSMMTAVKKADVVVANPTHIAVALKYDNLTMNAPTVVAKGAELMAAHIRRMAEDAGVPVTRDVPLARALYELEVDSEIPDELYEAVAVVLRWVYQLAEERGALIRHA